MRSVNSNRAETMRFSFVTALTEKTTVSGRAKGARWSIKGDKVGEITRSRTDDNIIADTGSLILYTL